MLMRNTLAHIQPLWHWVVSSMLPTSSISHLYALIHLLQEVASWLSPADLRRSRLVCRNWHAVLTPLSTTASTPLEPGTVGKWKAQLSCMVRSLPCLRELTIRSRLSDVAAQQLLILAAATQLRSLKIPHGQDLRDKSLQVGWESFHV